MDKFIVMEHLLDHTVAALSGDWLVKKNKMLCASYSRAYAPEQYTF